MQPSGLLRAQRTVALVCISHCVDCFNNFFLDFKPLNFIKAILFLVLFHIFLESSYILLRLGLLDVTLLEIFLISDIFISIKCYLKPSDSFIQSSYKYPHHNGLLHMSCFCSLLLSMECILFIFPSIFLKIFKWVMVSSSSKNSRTLFQVICQVILIPTKQTITKLRMYIVHRHVRSSQNK